MKSFFDSIKSFLQELSDKFVENDLSVAANALSFKLILSVFPIIIISLSVLGFMNLSYEDEILRFVHILPDQLQDYFLQFVDQLSIQNGIGILSTSVVAIVWTASTGFYSLLRAFRRAYGEDVNKKIIRLRLTSLLLLLLFAFCVILTLYSFTFNDIINNFLLHFKLINHIPRIFSTLTLYVSSALVIFIFLIVLNKTSVKKKLSIKNCIPGTAFTIVIWIVISKLFNIYINNFSKYSTIYGGIGTLFVFCIWVNIFSYVLVLGGQINAIMAERHPTE